MNDDWLQFVTLRLGELHPKIFGPDWPKLEAALLYFEYHRRLNKMGRGREHSQHPRNPYRTNRS